MAEIGTKIDGVRVKVAAKTSKFLTDLCDLYGPTFTDGGAGGDQVGKTPLPLAANVRVKYEGFGASRQFVVGGDAYTATHQLTMPFTAKTVAITPEYRIIVKARGLTRELIFNDPHITEDSMSVLLKVNATLVTQGYQQQ